MKHTNDNIILSIAHLRSLREGTFNFFVTVFSAILGYFQLTIIENKNLFIAILIVVVGDWIFGTAYAIKRNIWETQKAMKVIYYIFAYSIIVFVVLAIEKAHASAFFLSDAIIMPILLFQTISMLKNASLLGWIPKGALLEVLKKIDNYKAAGITKEEIIEEPINPT
jgi:phage-related holin